MRSDLLRFIARAVFAENMPSAKVTHRNSIRKRSLPPCERATEVIAMYCGTDQKRFPT